LASAFTSVGVPWATTLIAGITVTSLAVNTLCSLFGQPRIFFRMAKDGLLFQMFAKLHPTTLAPLWGTVCSGVVAGLISMCMSLDALSEMISIGALSVVVFFSHFLAFHFVFLSLIHSVSQSLTL
jgi:amino acid transporter